MIKITELPELTRSEKQVAWANSIRAKRIEGFKSWANFDKLENFEATLASIPEEKRQALREKAEAYIAKFDKVLGHTEAKWWIDTQYLITLEQLAEA